MNKKRLMLMLLLLLLVGAGGVYKLVLAGGEEARAKPKVQGEVYVLPKEFLVNLSDGHFAKVGVGLVFEDGFTATPEAEGHGGRAVPPEGFGPLTQEPLVRDIVTDVLTDSGARDLRARQGREQLKARIARRLKRSTDVEVHDVLFTDVAVQ